MKAGEKIDRIFMFQFHDGAIRSNDYHFCSVLNPMFQFHDGAIRRTFQL